MLAGENHHSFPALWCCSLQKTFTAGVQTPYPKSGQLPPPDLLFPRLPIPSAFLLVHFCLTESQKHMHPDHLRCSTPARSAWRVCCPSQSCEGGLAWFAESCHSTEESDVNLSKTCDAVAQLGKVAATPKHGCLGSFKVRQLAHASPLARIIPNYQPETACFFHTSAHPNSMVFLGLWPLDPLRTGRPGKYL